MKRKRGFSEGAQQLALVRPVFKPRKKARKAFVPGRDRTGGYYGRYAGAGGELKFFDSTHTDAVIAAGGVIFPSLNIIAQGTTESERIGRKSTLRNISWVGKVSMPEVEAAATPGPFDRIRLIMYLDKQTNGAAATQAQILEDTTFDSFRNLANGGRFTILMDKKIVLNYATLASAGAGSYAHTAYIRAFEFHKKCSIPIEWDSTTGAVSEMRTNNIGILLMCENGIAGIVSQARVRYSDN